MADPIGNEPAAPLVKTTETVQRVTAKYRGLTKREEIAKASMAGIRAGGSAADSDTVALLALRDADALLSALSDGSA